eukprot:TRINITY_DN50400_c0_g1_i1.p1 TRINITY_DN50400_c0_g1~~TRINITY_DN50400_c0_g1_i1.p1  ORF type:complete len:435 (-),score=53.65 TRINITY_DN50400_c0_g1_i1:25-1329(-)
MSYFGRCTIFCGSSFGAATAYKEAVDAFGRYLAEKAITVVYGGGNLGLMGTLANATLEAGGKVVGVMPKFMVDLERAHKGITSLEIVDNMQTRKRMMLEQGDAFIALPGGCGTLEELLEALEWTCCGRHKKPVGVLNLDGMFSPLVDLLQNAIRLRFEPNSSLRHLVVAQTPADLIAGLERAARAYADGDQTASVAAEVVSDRQASVLPGLDSSVPVPRGVTGVLADHCAPCEEVSKAAHSLGRLLAQEGSSIVLGTGSLNEGSGAWAVAQGAREHGGIVAGVAKLGETSATGRSGIVDVEVATPVGSEHVCHARKRRLLERSNQLVVLPGSVAIWEELLEVFSGAILGRHTRPLAVLNIGGFYNPLQLLLERSVQCGFTQREVLSYIVWASSAEELLVKLNEYNPTRVIKLRKPSPEELTSTPSGPPAKKAKL